MLLPLWLTLPLLLPSEALRRRLLCFLQRHRMLWLFLDARTRSVCWCRHCSGCQHRADCHRLLSARPFTARGDPKGGRSMLGWCAFGGQYFTPCCVVCGYTSRLPFEATSNVLLNMCHFVRERHRTRSCSHPGCLRCRWSCFRKNLLLLDVTRRSWRRKTRRDELDVRVFACWHLRRQLFLMCATGSWASLCVSGRMFSDLFTVCVRKWFGRRK